MAVTQFELLVSQPVLDHNEILTAIPMFSRGPELRPSDHVTAALKNLYWLPVKQRIEYKSVFILLPLTLEGKIKSSGGERPTRESGGVYNLTFFWGGLFIFWGGGLFPPEHAWIKHWYKLCLLMYKASVGKAPVYMLDILTACSAVPALIRPRLSASRYYIVPRTIWELGERAFSVSGSLL